ncbi:hypothetical protein BY458DRAFT_486295 [Sporodiniella umbellata]|nr:hypothetical protein BY458DRAFT_486295 [Sporodiniella umbellata]
MVSKAVLPSLEIQSIYGHSWFTVNNKGARYFAQLAHSHTSCLFLIFITFTLVWYTELRINRPNSCQSKLPRPFCENSSHYRETKLSKKKKETGHVYRELLAVIQLKVCKHILCNRSSHAIQESVVYVAN